MKNEIGINIESVSFTLLSIVLILSLYSAFSFFKKLKNNENRGESSSVFDGVYIIIIVFCYFLYLTNMDKELNLKPKMLLYLCLTVGMTILSLLLRFKLTYSSKPMNIMFFNIKSKYLMLILSLLSFFVIAYKIDVNPDFNNDEHYIIKAAYGFLQTGKFAEWDFVHNVILSPYDRGWLYTILIALNFRIFGFSVISGRFVNVYLGIIFICSCFYIFKKLTKSKGISFTACIFMLADYRFIDVFRTIRMYPLGLILMVWLVYFSIKAINEKNDFKVTNKGTEFLTKYFDFNIKYIIITLCLFYLNYIVVANSLFVLFGLIFYVFYKYIETKELKYKNASMIIIMLCSIIVLLYLAPNEILGGFLKEINRILNYHIKTGNIQVNYFWEIVRLPFGVVNNLVFLSVPLIAFCAKKDKLSSLMLFLYSNIIISILFFTFFTTHIYRYRYIVQLIPLLYLLLSIGICTLFKNFSFYQRIIKVLFSCMLFFTFTFTAKANYIMDESRPKLVLAYEQIKNIGGFGTDQVFGYYSYHFHSEYLMEYRNIEYKRMYAAYELREHEGKYGENEFNEFEKLVVDNSNGVISIEQDKYHLITPVFHSFLENWTDKIAGPGLDNYNVYIYKYQFIPRIVEDDIEGIPVEENEVFSFYLNEFENIIKVNLTNLSRDNNIILMKVYEGGKVNFYQILLEQEDFDKGYVMAKLPNHEGAFVDGLATYDKITCEISELYKISAGE